MNRIKITKLHWRFLHATYIQLDYKTPPLTLQIIVVGFQKNPKSNSDLFGKCSVLSSTKLNGYRKVLDVGIRQVFQIFK